MTNSNTNKYPFLAEILAIKGMPLQPVYTVRDVAKIFKVTPRAIQQRVAAGQIPARNLPGRARFLSDDLEAFLVSSRKKASNVR